MGLTQFLQVLGYFLEGDKETWMRHARRRMFSVSPDMEVHTLWRRSGSGPVCNAVVAGTDGERELTTMARAALHLLYSDRHYGADPKRPSDTALAEGLSSSLWG